ncbi:MAG: hypothetical protein JXJ04_13870 [Spirochaetales bacterium]|nr:hypothetical protein [Spirochaetales bacterium]
MRNRELLNYPDSFLELIEKEIFPLAEKGFSVDPEKRILFGHSNGGIFSLYTLFKQAKYGIIPMLEDLDKTHTQYDFSYPVQSYDWYFSEHFEHSAGRGLLPSSDPAGPEGEISCMKLECEFTDEDQKVPVSTGLEASVIPEIDLTVDIYVPAGLAELGYNVELYIVSSEKWLMEMSDKQTLKKGWNTYSFKWTEENSKGDLSNVGGIGLWIEKGENSVNWSGDIYIDNFEW